MAVIVTMKLAGQIQQEKDKPVGRQGKGGRTHLVSPAMAAAAAITGHLVDVRSLDVDLVPAGRA